MERRSCIWLLAVVTMLFSTGSVGLAAAGEAPDENPAGKPLPNDPMVTHAVRAGVSVPLRQLPPARPVAPQDPREVNPHQPRQLPGVARPDVRREDPLRQNFLGTALMPDPMINIEGQSDDENAVVVGGRVVPPDTNGDVGPNHYVQWINLIFSVYDKATGARVLGPIRGNQVFSGFGGPCETTNAGDPTVLYDQFADRWVISQFANATSASAVQCVAVSQTGDPTGAYFLYQFATPGNDYPKMGVWGDAYYMTYRNFSTGAFIQAVALQRDKMLVGDPTAASVRIGIPDTATDQYEGVLPPHVEGIVPPANGAPAPYVMSFDDEIFSTAPVAGQDSYKVWHFHVDWAVPANSTVTGPITVPTDEMDINLCGLVGLGSCIEQPAPGELLHSLAFFTMWRAVYRSATDTLWVNNTVDADGADTAGIRWAEIGGATTAAPTVNQAGTYAPADGVSRWMGSLAVDDAGNMALGYSASSTATFPSVRYAGRLAGDPPGELSQGEAEMWAGTGSQISSSNRWGDYSSMSLDESDGCTFWYTQEYYGNTASFDFKTRIGSFRFPTCLAAETGTITGTVTSQATGNPIAGAAVRAQGDFTFSTNTNAAGQYSMLVVADTYDVTASSFGYETGLAAGVEVADGAEVTVDFALVAAPAGTVSGYVRDTEGQPLAGATVSIAGTPIPPTTTDATGFYSFASVPNGTYSATAQAGRCHTPQTQALVVNGATTLDFTLQQRSDSFGYTCKLEDAAFEEATTVLPLTGDDVVRTIDLPFEFTFYGQTYVRAHVCTNGFVEFAGPTTTTCTFSNAAIPSTARPNGAVYPFWDDLFVDASASIRADMFGSIPNRRYVIEFRNIRPFGDTTRRMDFNVVLHENGDVVTQYRNLAADGRERGNSATLGIEHHAGTIALQYSLNEAVLGVEPAVTTIRYSPPPPKFVLAVNAGDADYTDSTGNLWVADQSYSAPGWGYLPAGAPDVKYKKPIGGTADPTLYQSARRAMSEYRFDVPNGSYVIWLRFAEIQGAKVGSRRFDVYLEGSPVLFDFDIVQAAGGQGQAYDRFFTVPVTDGQVNIQFVQRLGFRDPLINAIKVSHIPGT